MDEVDQGHYLHLLRFCLLLLWSRDNVTLLHMWPVVLVHDSSSSQLDLACMTHTYRNCPHFAVSGARRSFQMNCPSSLHLGVMAHAANLRIRRCGKKPFSGETAVPASSYRRKVSKDCTPFFGGNVGKRKHLDLKFSRDCLKQCVCSWWKWHNKHVLRLNA